MKSMATSTRTPASHSPSSGRSRGICLWTLSVALLVCSNSHAATWVTGSGNFTNPANWSTGIVPGPTEDALFTNAANHTVSWTSDATNANAFVNTPGAGTTTLGVGSQTWLLTNLFILGQAAVNTGTISHTTGTIVITNSAGTGTLVVGQAGKGTYTLAGGTVTLDQLFVTNNLSGSYTNSILALNSGTLNVLNSMTISALGNFNVGNSGIVNWNILGGTNLLATPGRINLSGNASGRALVTVSGPGTLWSNSASTFYIGGAGHGSELLINDQAHVISPASTLGDTGFSSNRVTVTGSNTIWDTGALVVGFRANTRNQLTITNGGLVRSASGRIGSVEPFATLNSVVVTDPGSRWLVGGALEVGFGGWSNSMTIANGGLVTNTIGYIGYSTANSNNVLVTGAGSSWLMNSTLMVGRQGVYSALVISDGALVSSTDGGAIGGTSLATSNTVLVTNPGSRWVTSNTFFVGQNSSANSLTISDGGMVSNTTFAYVGQGASGQSANNNSVLVTDPDSRWIIGNGLIVGNAPITNLNNTVTIANGGFLSDSNANIGNVAASFGSSVLVTGAGSLWQNSGIVYVGSNAVTKGNGASVLVTDSATLEANTLVSGFLVAGTPSGVISNSGGIYQFTKTNVTITANSPDSIVLNNGTISFRGVTNANVFGNWTGSQLTNMTFQGDNAFRLNSSSNANGVASYTFATGNPTNYAALELVNDSTLWRSTTLTIGGTGKLLVSNSTAVIAAELTSAGAVKVVDSHVRFASNVVLSSGYISDPSTNVFNANAAVSPSGFLQGGAGDLFQFESDLTLQSTNASLFDLKFATVLFTNGTSQHMLDLTGSWAIDQGSNFPGIASIPTNFAIGTFLLSGADSLHLTGDVANALYVGALDFGGLGNTNNLTLDVNLYYDMTLAANSYLGSNTFDLDGAGMLIPYPGVEAVIPEPSTLSIMLLAALGFAGRRRGFTTGQ